MQNVQYMVERRNLNGWSVMLKISLKTVHSEERHLFGVLLPILQLVEEAYFDCAFEGPL